MRGFPVFPEQASTFAGQVDTLYFVLIALSLIFGGVLPFIILYLMVRYHRSQKVSRANPVNSNLTLELTWTIIPLVLVLGVFFWGAFLYVQMRTIPEQNLEIYVIGKQWMWHAQHPNGKRENNELHVPIGQPVKLIMTSQDVIHSFYIPAFRVKQDVLPGRYTTMWFEATKEGEYHLFCAEYCGTEHSVMGGRIVALSLADYQTWLTTPGQVILPSGDIGVATQPTSGDSLGDPMAAVGEQLFTSLGCAGCHRMDGAGQGPSLAGLFGAQEQLADGSAVLADENYLRESILNPAAKLVEGYPNIMPPYEGQLSDDQVNQLIAYIKALADGGTPATSGEGVPAGAGPQAGGEGQSGGAGGAAGAFDADLAAEGEQIFTSIGCLGCHRDDGAGIGPSLVGLLGKERSFADGSSAVADEAYIRESIANSQARLVADYQPVMPPYANQLSDDEITRLVEYIKSLGN